MEAYRNADLEYQRFGEEIALAKAAHEEIKLWVLCVVIFMIDVIFQLFYASSLYNEVLAHVSVSPGLIAIIINFVALVVLGNGLFGKRFQGRSLCAYIIIFELIPFVLYAVTSLLLVVTLEKWKNWAKEQYPKANSTAVVACIWFYLFFSAGYHLLAAWIVNRYRKVARQ